MTHRDIAKMIDHAVLHPMQTERDLEEACALADAWSIGALCVKPCDVRRANTLLSGSSVRVCSVVGFPHGTSTGATKHFETSEALDNGASEIDMVVNAGFVIRENWSAVHGEISKINSTCTDRNGILKVIFETDFLTSDLLKVRLCEVCSEIGVAFVKTSTGFGFVKDASGQYGYTGATEHDVRLMRKHCHPDVQIKASGGIRTLNQLLFFHGLGATRIGTSSTDVILEEAKFRFGRMIN